MAGSDAVLWLLMAWGTGLTVAGFWMKHGIGKLDRKIEAHEAAERARAARAHPAE